MEPVYLEMSLLENVGQMLALILILVFILVLTYYVTRWIAKSSKNQNYAKNINVIETYRIAPNKYIQIIKVADKYLAIAVAKDTITMLAELTEEGMVLPEETEAGAVSFKEIFRKISRREDSDKTDK